MNSINKNSKLNGFRFLSAKSLISILAMNLITSSLSGCGSASSAAGAGTNPTGSSLLNGGTAASCIPLNQPIGFVASSGYYDGTSVRLGTIDPNLPVIAGQYGTVQMVTGGNSGPYMSPNASHPASVDGTIRLNIVSGQGNTATGTNLGTASTTYPTGYGSNYSASSSGIITVSPDKQNRVMNELRYSSNPYGYSAPTMQLSPASICVTGIRSIGFAVQGQNLQAGAVLLPFTVTSGQAMPGSSGTASIIELLF